MKEHKILYSTNSLRGSEHGLWLDNPRHEGWEYVESGVTVLPSVDEEGSAKLLFWTVIRKLKEE